MSLPMRLVFTVVAPFAAGFFLSQLYRAINAVIAPNLVADVGLSASELGIMTAAYLITFALFQLPLGILLDRFGPRRVQAALLLTTAVGSLLFSLGNDVITLSAARAVIGLGLAGGLMAGFKAVVLWFPPQRHALVNAWIMSTGGLGMLVSTTPAEFAVGVMGWRGLFVALAGFTAVVAWVVYWVVPERAQAPPTNSLRGQIKDLAGIFTDRYFWRLAPIIATAAGTHIAIQTLWAGPWFRDISGFDRDGVAAHLFLIGAAFLVGSLLLGFVADRLGRRGVDPVQVMLWAIVLFALSELGVIAQWTQGNLLIWTVFGMTGQAVVLAYPSLALHFGAALSGRAHTAMNLLLFSAAFAAQAFIGAVIDLFPTDAQGGYHPHGYQWAFGILLALQLLAFLWFFITIRRGTNAFSGLEDH